MRILNNIKAWGWITLPVTFLISTISNAQSSDGPGQSMESLQQYARDQIADSNKKANENNILMTMAALDKFNSTPRLQGWESLVFGEPLLSYALGMPLDKFIEPYQEKEMAFRKPAASAPFAGLLVGIFNNSEGMEVAGISLGTQMKTPVDYYEVDSLDDRVKHLFSNITVGFLRGQLLSVSLKFADYELGWRAFDKIVAQHKVVASKTGTLRHIMETRGDGIVCARLAANDGKEFWFSRDGFTMVNLPLIRACIDEEAQALSQSKLATSQSQQDALADLGLGKDDPGVETHYPTPEEQRQQRMASEEDRQNKLLEMRRIQMENDAKYEAEKRQAAAKQVADRDAQRAARTSQQDAVLNRNQQIYEQNQREKEARRQEYNNGVGRQYTAPSTQQAQVGNTLNTQTSPPPSQLTKATNAVAETLDQIHGGVNQLNQIQNDFRGLMNFGK